MARIRTIKPEFFTSESIVSITPLARLFFIGLWCEADREGRIKWKPKTLKIRYLPADNADINKIAQELIDEGMIVIYTVDDNEYCEIPSFTSHQVINNRERQSEIPQRDSDASVTRELHVKAERKEGKGKEGKGKEGKGTRVFAKPSTEQVQSYFEEKGYLDKTFGQKFVNHYDSNGWMVGKTKMKDWKAAVRNWIGRGTYKKSEQPISQEQFETNASSELDQIMKGF